MTTEKKSPKRNVAKRIRKVEEILRRWDPIGVMVGEFAPVDEYHSYAPHIVTLVSNGCSVDELSRHLNKIRTETIGLPKNLSRDREFAIEIRNSLGKKI